jgi:uncharacterized protein YjbJ (UPF0337 family)
MSLWATDWPDKDRLSTYVLFLAPPRQPVEEHSPATPRSLNSPMKDARWTKIGLKDQPKRAKGKIEETAGKITGDEKLKADGKADQMAGKVKNVIGGIKDTIRND